MFFLISAIFTLILIGCQSNQSGDTSTEAEEAINIVEDLLCNTVLTDLYNSTMSNEKLYSKDGSSCSEVEDIDTVGTTEYYSDSSCNDSVAFTPRTFQLACKNMIEDPDQEVGVVGNWSSEILENKEQTNWMSSQWAKLKVFNYPQHELKRPFFKEVIYHNETNGNKSCELVVRIYKTDLSLSATGLKSAVIMHGGGWKQRGLPAEIWNDYIATIFANDDKVVYAPYYRLTKDIGDCDATDGSGIVQDIVSFHNWFQNNAEKWGSDVSEDVTVLGFSAGGGLAHTFSQQSDSYKNVISFSGLLDMRFVTEQLDGGIYRSSDVASIDDLLDFLGINSISSVSTDPNTQNLIDLQTFPLGGMVGTGTELFPATKNYYMIHGSEDTFVPLEGSIRVCDSLSGIAYNSLLAEKYSYLQTDSEKTCHNNSKLFVIENGEHDMSLKCFTNDLTGDAKEPMSKFLDALGITECGSGGEDIAEQYESIFDDIVSTF